MDAAPHKRLYLVVAASALAVYAGALANGYAVDDVPIIATNPTVQHWAGVWQAFARPYWPPSSGAAMYRPLTVATYVLDRPLGVAAEHAVNLLLHAAVSVAVAWLLLRWAGSIKAALAGGLLFAVHPVHVEAVANVVGRAELLAAAFSLASVVVALEYDRLWWSLAGLALGLLSKETAATVPALIACGWIAGVGRQPSPSRRRAYLLGWLVVGAVYLTLRWTVLHPYAHQRQLAPVFVNASPVAVRLTAVGAFMDFARLLVFPLKLRVDYSPAERTLVSTPFDPRFMLGALCLLAWVGLMVMTWRRRRRIEALGLCWVGVALLPVANLLFPTGVLVAERTLYLPSVGLALAVGAWAGSVSLRPLLWAVLLELGVVRTALRVPVWASNEQVALSVTRDSPRSYVGPMLVAAGALARHRPEVALVQARMALERTEGAPRVLLVGADAAFTLGRPRLADSLLARLDQICHGCAFHYEAEAQHALARGDTAVSEEFLARARRLPSD